MAVVIPLKPATAATAKVFNQRAVGSGFPQKVLASRRPGKMHGQGRYRFSLQTTDLRGHTGRLRVASVIKNQAIGLSRRKAQTMTICW